MKKAAGAGLVLGALGVVFGDIGTSPLYTFQECIVHEKLPVDRFNIFGVISLIFWALTLVVTIKYVTVLMQADNDGEGGIMALLALVPEPLRATVGGRVSLVSLLVIAGAALLFGDGVVTPAISVLSAVEGVVLVQPGLKDAVVPATCLILLALFLVQRRGTGPLGVVFGPVMLTWFGVIGFLGLLMVVQRPDVLWALSPHHGVAFFMAHGRAGWEMLGSVVLAVTGGEALYADMGHFGRNPIRVAWLAVAYPCLVLCYLGQGALLLQRPEAVENCFFSLIQPGFATWLLVGLATLATVIASQALISAVFSLTQQAVRLGYLPRITILHTSSELEGRIYVPLVNWALALACIGLVLAFQKSTRLAAAYGLAVSGTMAITSVMFFYVTHYRWKWPLWRSVGMLALFLSLDIPFFTATCLKFVDGGWLPLALGVGVAVIMKNFCAGRSLLDEYLRTCRLKTDDVLACLDTQEVRRLPGLAVVLTHQRRDLPPVLSTLINRFKVLHESVLLVTVTSEGVPHVAEAERLDVTSIGQGLHRVFVHSGFMEMPSIPAAVERAMAHLELQPCTPLYIWSREHVQVAHEGRMRGWQEALFAFLLRNATSPAQFYQLPPEQVVEIGTRVDL